MSVVQINNYKNEGKNIAKVDIRESIDGVRYSTHIIPEKEYKIAAEIAKDETKNFLDYHTDLFSISGERVNIGYEFNYNHGKNKILTMNYDEAAYMRKYFLKVIRKKVDRIRRRERIEAKIYELYQRFIKLIKGDEYKKSMKSINSIYNEITTNYK